MSQIGVTHVLLNEFNTYLNMYKKLSEKLNPQGEKEVSNSSNVISNCFSAQTESWPTNG